MYVVVFGCVSGLLFNSSKQYYKTTKTTKICKHTNKRRYENTTNCGQQIKTAHISKKQTNANTS